MIRPLLSPAFAAAFAITLAAGLLAPSPGAAQGAAVRPGTVARREVFFAGGRYAGDRGREVMHGQMQVEALWPREVRQPFALVLIAGAGQTAALWTQTPDGRKGWAEYFIEQGYRVYLVDPPGRGRSAWHPAIDGGLAVVSAPEVERLWTAPEVTRGWPQAARHTRWPGEGPGKGRMGDPIFDAFYRSQLESPASPGESELRMQEAGAALLDIIGPSILITHGEAGPAGWALAEARPHYVKGIVALEPAGPPFENAVSGTGKARVWGISDIALSYIPPAATPSDLQTETQERADGPDLVPCVRQKEPARKLTNLAGVRTLIVTSEAGAHAGFDHCTAAYLKQAGVPVDFARLEEQGITGNGALMMLETNNMAVAGVLHGWMSRTIRRAMPPPK